MSSFICEYCEAEIVDSPEGYVTECEHYPKERQPTPEELQAQLAMFEDG